MELQTNPKLKRERENELIKLTSDLSRLNPRCDHCFDFPDTWIDVPGKDEEVVGRPSLNLLDTDA